MLSILDVSKDLSQYPQASLIALFISWKLVLLFIAIASPGLGYDTSTFLLPSQSSLGINSEIKFKDPSKHIINKFVRWDAIYFTQIAQRGYLFEQEWAFGWGFTRLVNLVGRSISFMGIARLSHSEAMAGIVVAHASHLSSVLVLYKLSMAIFRSNQRENKNALALAFVSACLHIIAPAGIFLSAPYAESLFSLLQFSGFLLYAKSVEGKTQSYLIWRDIGILFAGILLGFATTVRSNGIVAGIIFAYDAVLDAINLLLYNRNLATCRKLLCEVLAGLAIAIGAAMPQYLAYREFCIEQEELRPWCLKYIPSVYAWVQSFYWNNGFMKYWTVSNVPLFILATPMMFFMTLSASWAIWENFEDNFDGRFEGHTVGHDRFMTAQQSHAETYLSGVGRRLALPQLVLAVLAFTNSHVQIITRISSGYPVFYWWLASMIVSKQNQKLYGGFKIKPELVVRVMVMYGLIQGGLFSSFLPPA